MEATYIEKAIERAIAAGWPGPAWLNPKTETQRGGSWGENHGPGNSIAEWEYEYYLLDREFWQYLAKAEEWGYSGGERAEGAMPRRESPGLHYWHRFISHVAKGKDAESFLRTILKPAEKQAPARIASSASTDSM